MSQFLASFFLIRINKKTSVFLHNAPKILREGKILAYLLVSFERERERKSIEIFIKVSSLSSAQTTYYDTRRMFRRGEARMEAINANQEAISRSESEISCLTREINSGP